MMRPFAIGLLALIPFISNAEDNCKCDDSCHNNQFNNNSHDWTGEDIEYFRQAREGLEYIKNDILKDNSNTWFFTLGNEKFYGFGMDDKIDGAFHLVKAKHGLPSVQYRDSQADAKLFNGNNYYGGDILSYLSLPEAIMQEGWSFPESYVREPNLEFNGEILQTSFFPLSEQRNYFQLIIELVNGLKDGSITLLKER